MIKPNHPEPLRAGPEFAERRMALEETSLPRACTHDEVRELLRGSRGTPPRRPRAAHCRRCGHTPPGDGALRAREVPGLTHALLFFCLSWGLYLLNPYPPLRTDVAMLTAWLVCFAVSLRLRTPLRSARNALVIIFFLSWLVFLVRSWNAVTPGYLLTHWLHKLIDCTFAVTPIFVAAGIRALIRLLKSRARGRVEEF